MRPFIAIIALALTCAALTCAAYKVSDYALISLHLINSTSSSEPSENLDVAASYLEQLKVHNASSPLIASLRMLLKLRQLEEPSSCNLRGYEILVHANAYGADKSYRPSIAFESMDRINQIIRGIGRRHALMCQPHYKATYLERTPRLDAEYLQKVNTLAEAILDSWIQVNPDINADGLAGDLARRNAQAMKLKSLDDIKLLQCFVSKLKDLVDDSRRKYLSPFNGLFGAQQAHKQAIQVILDEYVFLPCDYYAARMSDLFTPLSFDMFFGELLATRDEDLQRMYRSMNQFRVCTMLMGKNRDKFIKKVRDVVKSKATCGMQS